MSVVSYKELPRKGTFEILKTAQLTREFVCVLSDDNLTTTPATAQDCFDAINIRFNASHPEYMDYRVRKLVVTESYDGSPYHTHVLAEYGKIYAWEFTTPASRPNLWEFDSAPGEVPALYYYEGSGNGTMRPLTNSAYDYFPGLVTQESTVTATVTKNFTELPTSWIAAQNNVNNSSYLGGPAHSWKVQKVTVVPAVEEFNKVVISYWKAVAELHYRQSGHSLQLPDVGFNFLDGSEKRRCMVFDYKNNEWIPSPSPVGLDGNGAQTFGAPDVLDRRVNPEIDFQSLFGSPPTTPPPLATG